jgi:hypothetical protein
LIDLKMNKTQEIRDSIAASTQQWINSISSQKSSQNNSENYSAQNSVQPTTSTSSDKATFDNLVEKNTGAGSGVKFELPPFPNDSTLHVLTVTGQTLAWTATEDC